MNILKIILRYVISMIIILSEQTVTSSDVIDYIFCDLIIEDNTRETHMYDLSILKVLTYLRKVAREKVQKEKINSEFSLFLQVLDVDILE